MNLLKLLAGKLRMPFAAPASPSPSDAPSQESGSKAQAGPTRTDLGEDFKASITQVIQHAYIGGIAVNGDYYRYNAQVVAAAASLGLLTTETSLEGFTRTYRPTHAGLSWCQR